MNHGFVRIRKALSALLIVTTLAGTLSGCSSLLGGGLLDEILEDSPLGGGIFDDFQHDDPIEESEEPVAETLPVSREMDVPDLAEYSQARTVTITAEGSGVGTGFFIDDQGTLVTCYHVIDGATNISVTVSDEATYDLQHIIDFDVLHDIAVLKIDVTGNPYFDICEGGIRAGESVYAVGSSLGQLSGTFSDGIVSTVSRQVGRIDCVQTTAPISSGNSGGPLVNGKGEVIGINAFSYTDGENLNLAVSIDTLDILSMDKNWSISKFREWYDKETHRSYFIYNLSQDAFLRSTVHTYQHVTGRTCLASTDSWDLSSYVDGYSEGYLIYYYEYKVDEFDAFTEYLYSIGYDYSSQEEFGDGTSYYYVNEFTASMVDIFVSSELIGISAYSV